MTLDRGTVLLVELDPTVATNSAAVAPVLLYPGLAPGSSGLTKASYALVDHLRSIDKRRIRRIFGQVSSNELANIDQGLELLLGLGVSR